MITMTKILLTGGSGFIGRNLYEQLRDKYDILAPRHKELDLLNLSSLQEFVKKNNIPEIKA